LERIVQDRQFKNKKSKNAQLSGGAMDQSHDAELQQSETEVQIIDSEPAFPTKEEGIGNNNVARISVLAIVAISILVIPLITLLLGRAQLLPKLPILVGSRDRSVNTDSAVLAVDTFGLSIQAKNHSASMREVLEQATVEHLARLHRTYSRWANTNGELMGSLLLKLTVDATGKVVGVDALKSHTTNSGFTKSVLDDVRKWKFPRVGFGVAEMTVPLLFVPKGMDPETVVQWERKVRSAEEDETPVAEARAGSTASASSVSQRAPAVTSESAAVIQPNPVKAPAAEISKPKAKQVLIAARTNRSVAIRESPRFSAKTVHEVDEDTQLNIIEKEGDWLKVKIADDGFIGFVRKEFVSPIN
jgi:hypothetical protein